MNCVNCGEFVDSTYCPNCGQKANTKRLSISFLWMDFQSRIYGFDGVFPRTIKDLTLKPGLVVNRFVAGNRMLYVGPVGYFFLMIALSILLMEATSLDFYQMVKATSPIAGTQTTKQELVQRSVIEFIASHFRLFRFLLIPVTAFWIWIFFRKRNYNYIESSVPAFYAQGHMEILFMLNLVLLFFFGFHFNQTTFLLEPAYYGFVFATMTPDSKFRSFFKGVLIWILSLTTFVILFGTAAVIWIFNNPELLQQIKPNTAIQ